MPVRSTYQDARGTFQLGYDDNGFEKQDNGTEKPKLKRQLSSDDIAYRNIAANINKETIIKDLVDGDLSKRMSFADLGKQKVRNEFINYNILVNYNCNGDHCGKCFSVLDYAVNLSKINSRPLHFFKYCN